MNVLQVYVGRIQKYVGAYMMKLRGRVDAIVVAGGAGEASSDLRQRLFSEMQVGPQRLFVPAKFQCDTVGGRFDLPHRQYAPGFVGVSPGRCMLKYYRLAQGAVPGEQLERHRCRRGCPTLGTLMSVQNCGAVC